MKWAVLVSGSGTILESMIHEGLRPQLVLADRPGTRAVDVVAKSANLPTAVVDRKQQFGYLSTGLWRREEFTTAIANKLSDYNIDLVAMAGFDTILSTEIFNLFGGKILNTHPALLPAFTGLYGANVIQATLSSGHKIAGCTIHLATEVVDDSRYILAQKEVPVLPDDTVESLWERIKIEERKLYPQVIRGLMKGRIVLPKVSVIIKQ